jgi:hypothetical protein
LEIQLQIGIRIVWYEWNHTWFFHICNTDNI